MHPPLIVKFAERFRHLASCQMLNRFFERRVALTDDFVEPSCLDSRLLQQLIPNVPKTTVVQMQQAVA